MTQATTTHTNTPRRAHPAVLRAVLRSYDRNDTESGRVAAQQRGTHRPTPCGYNRLIEVHDAANAIVATYRYDSFGRRLSKTANNQSSYYFYSAEGLIAEADSNGQIIQSYGYAPGSTFSTNPLWTKLTTAGTTTYYTYQNDHLGTPQKLLNQSGLTVWSATYDAFGKATVDPASTITNNLRFPGQYADQETGLHYNWMRFYDPSVGRYSTSDPIGLRGGINTYTYASGSPITGIDPLGLASDGGPYHPPPGTKLKCVDSDSCSQIEGKMQQIKKMIDSHTGWDRNNPPPRGGGRHAEEIADLWGAYARCQAIFEKKGCGKDGCPPKKTFTEWLHDLFTSPKKEADPAEELDPTNRKPKPKPWEPGVPGGVPIGFAPI